MFSIFFGFPIPAIENDDVVGVAVEGAEDDREGENGSKFHRFLPIKYNLSSFQIWNYGSPLLKSDSQGALYLR